MKKIKGVFKQLRIYGILLTTDHESMVEGFHELGSARRMEQDRGYAEPCKN